MQISDPVIEVFLIVSLLSFLPALLIMFTSFTRLVVVFSLMRQAISGQQIPPNPVIIGLSLFLTFYIMSPTIDTVVKEAIEPYMDKQIDIKEAFKRSEYPLKKFMLRQTREKDIALFLKMSGERPPSKPEELSLKVLAPAFAISELRTAFEIGFLIFLPFLIIDIVVSSILLSLGMMMLPPVLISLPFKLLLFVLADGWNLVVGSMLRSFQ
ncbi:Flagellar biosynthetic protein FliP [bacterium HR37]|nr:Flagellar biosynthetic protein FliP [bacterium HR37]